MFLGFGLSIILNQINNCYLLIIGFYQLYELFDRGNQKLLYSETPEQIQNTSKE